MNITVNRTTRDNIIKFQNQYYQHILVPIDDYWEDGIIAKGTYYEIISQKPIGYLVVDDDKVLLQFYLYSSREKTSEVFKFCIKTLQITDAIANTYEPDYLNLCLDQSNHHEIIALFYKDDCDISVNKPLPNLIEKVAELDDLDAAIIYSEVQGAPAEWLKIYYYHLIQKKSLYLYLLDNKIIASGELRPSKTSRNAANIGMTVSSQYRKLGLGSYILYRMKTLSKDMDLTPVCGTDVDNIASQKTILKCGFYPYHRALKIKLN